MVTLCIFFCSMSFIQVDQEFVVETDTTVNNTGEDIMVETGEDTVSVSNSNKTSVTLVDTEDRIISHPWKYFRLAACSHIWIESFGGYAVLYFKAVPQFYSRRWT